VSSIPARIPSQFTEWAVQLLAHPSYGWMQPQLGVALRMRGRLDEERLRRAMRLTLDAEPVLGCRWVLEKRPYWERRQDLDSLELLQVRDVSSADVEGEALTFLGSTLDPCADPQVRGCVFRTPDDDVLCLQLDHIAVDAGAVKEYGYLLADVYRRLEADPTWRPEPNLEGARNVAPALKGRGFGEKLKAMRQQDDVMPASDWRMPGSESREGQPRQMLVRMPAERFRPAREWARQRGATVNDALTAAYFRACAALLDMPPGAKAPIGQSCELRKYLPDGTRTALANISSVWYLHLPGPEPGETFEQTLSRVVECSRAWKASDPGFRTAAQMSAAEPVLRLLGYGILAKQAQNPRRDAGKGSPTMTNLGVLAEERLDYGVPLRDAFLTGPVTTSYGCLLTVSTFRDELSLSSGFLDGVIDPPLVAQLLARTVAELDAAAAEAVSA
jgi:NRPS condensation-like uncharacterized protein